MKATKQTPTGECDLVEIVMERNRYFAGKYMTADDFELDPAYALSRHRLHNRLLHGWGVVCGLDVRPHSVPKCRPDWVTVEPGIALDCLGRELILHQPMAVEVPLPTPPGTQKEYIICVSYEESPTAQVPVLYEDGPEGCQRVEYNRVRECVALRAIEPALLPKSCRKLLGLERSERSVTHPHSANTTPYSGAPAAYDKNHEPGATDSCLEPDCRCCDCVPLAIVTVCKPETPADRPAIDPSVRRYVGRPAPAPVLPTYGRIVGINWPHGGVVGLSDLSHRMNRRLEITFDRQLQAPPVDQPYAWGINSCTFEVYYLNAQWQKEPLGFPEDQPPALDAYDPCRAVFTLEESACSGRMGIGDTWLYVILKCDFILDRDGQAVDGNHIAGRCPSGNGTSGGTFESWFYVRSDESSVP